MAITISAPHFKESVDDPNIKQFVDQLESFLDAKFNELCIITKLLGRSVNELLNVENASSEEVLEMYQKFNEIEQRYIDLYYRMQPQNGDKSSMEAYDEIDEHFVLGNSAFEFILTYHTIKNAPDDKKQIYIDLETYCNLKLRELPRNIESAIVFMHTNRNQFVNLCNSFEHHHVNSMLV